MAHRSRRESKAPERAEKVCPTCGRPFQWRRKWARDWDQVVYCSERCRRERHRSDESAAAPRSTGT